MRETPPDKLSAKEVIRELINRREATSSPIHTALNAEFGYVDDDAVRRLVSGCRTRTPDATDDEIATFITMTARRIRK